MNSYIVNRSKEASSLAGVAGLIPAVGQILMDWRNPYAWGSLIAGVMAIVVPEKKAE